MSLHPYDIMELRNSATILLTPCPGTKEADIISSVAQLQKAGASAIITLMPKEEMQRFNAVSLPEICEQNAIRWIHLPIEDNTAPQAEFQASWQQHREYLHQLLAQEGTVAIHCKGGSGRTGLMAAIILIEQGMPLEEVISSVQALRPKALKVPAHHAYISQLASCQEQVTA